MNYRKIAYFIMTLSFIMIISGSVSSFVKSLQMDRRETYKRIADVDDKFQSFNDDTSSFESIRDELYGVVLSNVYYDSMAQEDASIKMKLTKYESLVDQLTGNVSLLDDLCDGVYYPDTDTNSKCKNYKSIYEQVVNYFVSDINLYNSYIDNFNSYQKENGGNLVLKKYNTKKAYIDYNKDGEFDGKEE